MISPDDGDAVEEVAKPVQRPGRFVFGPIFLVLALVFACDFGYRAWLLSTAPAPPDIDLSDADPDVAEAIEDARQLVNKHPLDAAAWGHLGMMLQAHSYYAQAQICYLRAEELERRNPQWSYLQATCATKSGSVDVIPSLERSVQCEGPNHVPRLVLGETLLEQDRLDEAEQHFAAVLATDPRNARAHLGMGRVVTARGDLRASVEHLERSIACEQRIRQAYDLLSAAHHALGEKNRAEEVQREADLLSGAGDLWPDPYLDQVADRETGLPATSRRANSLFSEGKTKEALGLLERLTQKRPNSAPAHSGLGRMLVLCQQPADAIPQLEEALRLDPNLAIPNFYLGAAFALQGKSEESAKAYRRSIELQPNHADAHYELSLVLYKLRDRDGAAQSLRECLRYNPNSVLAARALGMLLAEQEKHEEAVFYLTQAAKLAPEDKELEQLLKMVRLKQAEEPVRP